MTTPTMKLILHVIALTSLFFAGATGVRADLIAYEGFGYAVTNDAGIGTLLTNGYGWAEGSYWTRENEKDTLYVTAGSLTYGAVVVTSNKFELVGTIGRFSNRSFTHTIDSSLADTIWGGIVMKTPSNKSSRTSRFKLRNGGTTQFYVFADSATNIVVGGGSAPVIDTGIASGTSNRFYLYKIDLSGVEPVAQLWISPPNFSSEAELGTPSVTITNIGAVFTSFSLGASGVNPGAYDEIRIGTTLADAWKTLPPVGSPTTVLIIK